MISESLGVEMMGHWEVPEGKKDKMQGDEGHKGQDGSGWDKVQCGTARSPP